MQTKDGGIGPLSREELLTLIDWASGIEIGRPDLDVVSPAVPMTHEIVRFVDRRMTKGQNHISAFDASEGALYVLFALALLFHPNTPRIFGVEGLDHALHPRLARALVRIMSEHVGPTGKQILLTTHNPLVLDGLALQNDDIRLFTVDRSETGETLIHRVDERAPGAVVEAEVHLRGVTIRRARAVNGKRGRGSSPEGRAAAGGGERLPLHYQEHAHVAVAVVRDVFLSPR